MYSKCTSVMLCCVGRACFLIQTHAQVASRAVTTDGNSRDAHHHECPLWASLRYNTGLLISHWINFILSTNLFCDIIHKSKLLFMLQSREAFLLYTASLQILQWFVWFKGNFLFVLMLYLILHCVIFQKLHKKSKKKCLEELHT